MKYRHSFHAGNFADVHKHVTLLALLAALARKDKGFLYLETHAGPGAYEIASGGARAGLAQVLAGSTQTAQSAQAAQAAQTAEATGAVAATGAAEPEIAAFAAAVNAWRQRHGHQAYPGSPLLAAQLLRPQDRAVFVELQPPEAHALERALRPEERGPDGRAPGGSPRPRREPTAAAHVRTPAAHLRTPAAHVRVEMGDGFERLRAHLPPAERRGLVLIDPPYEQTQRDFERAAAAVADSLRRFATGVIMLWYPIKDARDSRAWREQLVPRLGAGVLVGELWVHPCDSKVALNGSGLLIVNPPYLIAERMRVWLPTLADLLAQQGQGGSLVLEELAPS
ncbi:MAG TPA: 23S rRNA (adenine(2030)-N(6))-methyltransferase RlmJ [Steroidobacteraceae bacterium]|nr:23S rRNA (adenine(2030)-N(6))-methyltransferase RlmJ [Steroidobacteraceae bacterium]